MYVLATMYSRIGCASTARSPGVTGCPSSSAVGIRSAVPGAVSGVKFSWFGFAGSTLPETVLVYPAEDPDSTWNPFWLIFELGFDGRLVSATPLLVFSEFVALCVPISGGGGVFPACAPAAGFGFSAPFGVLPIEEGSALLLGIDGLLLFSATSAFGVSTGVGFGAFAPGAALTVGVLLVAGILTGLFVAVIAGAGAAGAGAVGVGAGFVAAVVAGLLGEVVADLFSAVFTGSALLAAAVLAAGSFFATVSLAGGALAAAVLLGGGVVPPGAGVLLGAAEFFASVPAGVAGVSGPFGIGFAEFVPLITIDATVSRLITA